MFMHRFPLPATHTFPFPFPFPPSVPPLSPLPLLTPCAFMDRLGWAGYSGKYKSKFKPWLVLLVFVCCESFSNVWPCDVWDGGNKPYLGNWASEALSWMYAYCSTTLICIDCFQIDECTYKFWQFNRWAFDMLTRQNVGCYFLLPAEYTCMMNSAMFVLTKVGSANAMRRLLHTWLMSVPMCRDARCNRTHFLSGAWIVPTMLINWQA